MIEVTQEVVDFRTRVEHQQPLAEASPQQGNNSGASGTGVGGGHRHRGSLPGAQGSHQDSADRSPGTNASSGTEKSKENNLHRYAFIRTYKKVAKIALMEVIMPGFLPSTKLNYPPLEDQARSYARTS